MNLVTFLRLKFGCFPHCPVNSGLMKKFKKFQKKRLTKWPSMCIMNHVAEVHSTKQSEYGSIAQLGEHLPYKQEVTGSSPVVPTIFGPVVQSVSTPACHAGGRRFESVPGRQIKHLSRAKCSAQICLCSSVGRAAD